MVSQNKVHRGVILLRDQNRRNKIHQIPREQLIAEFEAIGINSEERREILWIINGALTWVIGG